MGKELNTNIRYFIIYMFKNFNSLMHFLQFFKHREKYFYFKYDYMHSYVERKQLNDKI